MFILVICLVIGLYLLKSSMVSQTGLNFIIKEEGFRDANFKLRFDPKPSDLFSPYNNDGAGNWTTGIGHLILKNEEKLKLRPITFDEAMDLYKADIGKAVAAVERNVKRRLLLHEKDALVSMAFNLGEGNFKSSQLVSYLNSGGVDPQMIRFYFEQWRSGGLLLNRRKKEADLFLNGKYV
jgi:lysozyme